MRWFVAFSMSAKQFQKTATFRVLARLSFCQDFSKYFDFPKRLDGNFRGEIWQFEGRELANLSP
jgi:hypothetical protein